jgi:hypothetical protein
MKKVIKKYWGIGLILVLLSTLFIAAAPTSAADPLKWEMKLDAPSTLFGVLAPGTDVVDFATNDGVTMYAITRGFGITAAITTAFTEVVAGETFTMTYTNEVGTAGQIGSIVFTAGTLGTAGAVTLAAGDMGVTAVTGLAPVAGDATAGVVTVYGSDIAATVLATYTFGGAFAAGAANPGGDTLRQTTSGGAIWSNITARLPAGVLASLDYLAMAPDDSNFVVVASATPSVTGVSAAVTTDGGATFSSMGNITNAVNVPVTGVLGVAVAPLVTGNIRYIAVFGTAGANLPGLFYYNYGAGIGAWRNACTDFTNLPVASGAGVVYDNVVAFAFSPNFPSDYMGVTLFEDTGAVAVNGVLDFHILSFNSLSFDTPVSAGYPTVLYTASAAGAAGITVNDADLAMLPDYDGGDESLRIVFGGASITDAGAAGESGGIWRMYDNAPPAKIYGVATAGLGTGVTSVAYDGTTLVAGMYATNNVFRSADPMVTSPTFLPARTLKKIGIDDPVANDMVKVRYAGTTLIGSKMGLASAMSKSLDYGNIWNDFTLLDSALTVVDDIYMTAAGDPWYLSARDGFTSSVYRISMYAVTRVLCVAVGPDFMLKGVAAEPDVIYAADEGGTILYYSADGGTARWYLRGSVPAAITDLAVESQQVIYVGSGINVYKSTNSGFTWSLPVNCKLAGGNVVNQMVSLGDSKLLIGGSAGGVVWSTDGGASWFPAMGVLNTFSAVLVAATGLGTGDFVFAAEEGNNMVWRCEIGPSNPFGEFKSMNMPTATAAETNVGLELTNGVLYALSASGTTAYINRSLAPAIPGTHTGIFWGTRYAQTLIFGVTITSVSALRTSAGAPGDIMLYTLDGPITMYFQDTIALSGPTLIGPEDGKLVQIVSPLTGATQQVNFTWSRLSLATSYLLQVALDSAFNELISGAWAAGGVVTSSAGTVSFVAPAGTVVPGTTYYWRVMVLTPIGSAFSETRSFIVQPTAATVPSIEAPAAGATDVSETPAFTWSAVAGTNLYEFQLSEGTAFGVTLVSETTASTAIKPNVTLEAGKTYFWRVRALEPVQGDWSAVGSFTVAVPAEPAPPPITITTTPPPQITVTTPAPPPATTIAPPVTEEIAPAYIWAIIIIGAVLVIAVIVLIVRTRRST